MKAKNSRFVAFLLIGAGLFFAPVFFQIASAQTQGLGLSISPLTFELTANPGDTLVNKLRVYNPTEAILSVRMDIEDFTVAGELGEVKVVPAETETYSIARWIDTEPTEFTLGPKEQKFVDFIIEVPQNAEPGGKYGSVLAGITAAVGELGITGAAVVQKVGSLVLLTVSGQVVENLWVKEFSAPGFSETGPVSFAIRFENTGTVHVRPKGFVTITDWRDKKVIDIPFPQQNVIPGAIRRVDAAWSGKWLVGRFAATLVGSYGISNTPFEPQVLTFWVFPWKIALGVLLVFIVLIFFFYKTQKRWQIALKVLIHGEKILASEEKKI